MTVQQDYGGSSTRFYDSPYHSHAQLAISRDNRRSMIRRRSRLMQRSVSDRQSFADEYGNGNKIPSNMISSVAQAMQAYFPAPNVANPTVVDGITTNNYFYNYLQTAQAGPISGAWIMTSPRRTG